MVCIICIIYVYAFITEKNYITFKFGGEFWSCLHFRDQKEKILSTF